MVSLQPLHCYRGVRYRGGSMGRVEDQPVECGSSATSPAPIEAKALPRGSAHSGCSHRSAPRTWRTGRTSRGRRLGRHGRRWALGPSATTSRASNGTTASRPLSDGPPPTWCFGTLSPRAAKTRHVLDLTLFSCQTPRA